MKKIRAKLKSRKGDSIAEVLVALLIAGVALVLLASMITSSTNIISRSRERMETYYADNNALAAQSGGGGEATVTVKNGDSTLETFTVTPFVNHGPGNTDVISYRRSAP